MCQLLKQYGLRVKALDESLDAARITTKVRLLSAQWLQFALPWCINNAEHERSVRGGALPHTPLEYWHGVTLPQLNRLFEMNLTARSDDATSARLLSMFGSLVDGSGAETMRWRTAFLRRLAALCGVQLSSGGELKAVVVSNVASVNATDIESIKPLCKAMSVHAVCLAATPSLRRALATTSEIRAQLRVLDNGDDDEEQGEAASRSEMSTAADIGAMIRKKASSMLDFTTFVRMRDMHRRRLGKKKLFKKNL